MSATGIIDHVVRPQIAMTEDKYLREPSSGAAQAYLPGAMPPGVARVVGGVTALLSARTMDDHCRPMPLFARDMVWDAPPFLLNRKGSVRVSSYFQKFFASERFVASHVEVRRVGLGQHVLEVSGTLEILPRRTLFVPASLLLPEVIPIRSTLTIGVNGPLDSGEVELVVAKWHNLPALPNFVRALNGLAFGTVPHLLEPIWSYLPEFIGDDFYRRRRERTFASRHPNSSVPLLDAAKDAVTDTAQGVMDYGVGSVSNLREGASYLWNNFMEAAGFAVGRARAYTGAAADLASQVASTAYETAANVASTATDVAAGVATKTYDTTAGAATQAYDTAAGAAGAAYEAGAKATGAAAEVGREGVDAGRQAVDSATLRAQQAAGDARRGYHEGKVKPVQPAATTHAPAGVAM